LLAWQCLELDKHGMVRRKPHMGSDSPDGIKPYFELIQKHRGKPFYLLQLEFVHELWEFLQESTSTRISMERPPSSGFLGIAILRNLRTILGVNSE
jgi:hypothetical protein